MSNNFFCSYCGNTEINKSRICLYCNQRISKSYYSIDEDLKIFCLRCRSKNVEVVHKYNYSGSNFRADVYQCLCLNCNRRGPECESVEIAKKEFFNAEKFFNEEKFL